MEIRIKRLQCTWRIRVIANTAYELNLAARKLIEKVPLSARDLRLDSWFVDLEKQGSLESWLGYCAELIGAQITCDGGHEVDDLCPVCKRLCDL